MAQRVASQGWGFNSLVQTSIFHWFSVTPQSPQVHVYIVDICWAHIAVESGFSQLWSMEPVLFDVVYIVSSFLEHKYWSCGMEFQKLFSSCYSAKGIWSSHTGLCDSNSHKLIALYTEHSPLAAEPWSTPSTISVGPASSASLSSPFFMSLLRWFPLFRLSSLVYWAISGLHEPMCNVEILHRAQIGQNVYRIHTYHIFIYK